MTPRGRLSAIRRAQQGTGSLPLLGVLLAVVPLLCIAHQLYFWDVGPFDSPRWAVNSDRSFIEILGYLQLRVAVVLLLVVGLRWRAGAVYTGWAAALTVIVLDDSLGWHERGGAWLARAGVAPELLGLPRQELGELITWALLGVPILAVLWLTHRVSPARARQDSWWLAGLSLVLLFFGIGVDGVHEVVEELTDNSVVDLLVTFAEGGGELAGMSGLLAYVVYVVRRRPAAGDPPSPARARHAAGSHRA